MIKNNVKKEKNKKKRRVLFIILLIIAFACLSFFIWINSIVSSVKLDNDLLSSLSSPISLYDDSGDKLTESVTGEPCVKLNTLNSYTINAFVDIEDKNFYTHKGISLPRIFKAFFTNIFSGGIEQGASTISQQLIKNTHLSNEKTYTRKIKEIALAMQLEKKYTKEQILEMYLNAIYFGNGCYGIQSASNFYFNKPANELDVNESCILAGIIKSPASYNPISNEENITNRKNLILKTMLQNDHITKEEYNTNVVKELNLDINYDTAQTNKAYYSSAISQASDILKISPTRIASLGYKIYTYFDKETNELLEKNSYTSTNALHNSIVVDNENYGVVAYSSSFVYGSLSIKRSPASTIKPFLVYTPAIEKGLIQPSTLILDEQTTFNNEYTPKNINNVYYGNISAKEALAKSLNVPAVKTLEKIGINNAKNYAQKLNIPFSDKDNGLSLALGSMYEGITIEQLVNAYSPYVFKGNYNKLSFIKQIKDSNDKVIFTNELQNKKVISEQTSFLMGTMLKQSTKTGTCQALKEFNFDVLAKSGTNGTENPNKNTDSICIAQTTRHTACIWYFSKNYEDENLIENASISGLSPTIRIKNIFEELYKDNSPNNFNLPNKIKIIDLDLIDYEQGNLTIAQPKAPKNYRLQAYFNETFAPSTYSKNFSSLITPIITYTQNNQGLTINFLTEPSQNYELIIEEYDSNNQLINYTVEQIEKKENNICSEKIDTKNDCMYKIYLNTNFIQDNNYISSNIILINKTNQSNWFYN